MAVSRRRSMIGQEPVLHSQSHAQLTAQRRVGNHGVIQTCAVGGHPARHKESVKNKGPLISVVDDDESVRESLPDLLRLFGFSPQAFSSAEEFLASDQIGQTMCLILDIAMPGMTGPDLQRELKVRQIEIPIIFMTAGRDDTVRPRLLKEGAVECLFKPFSDLDLLDALNTALRVN